jgi:lipid-binding SYLF domain-containing protein
MAYILWVISSCRGIAVFHVLRAGLRSPSASGSGVVVSRLPTGQWSSASTIVVEYDLPQDIDVADMVVVINSQDDLDCMSSQRELSGKGLDIEPGPIPESDAYAARARRAPQRNTVSFSYSKSKGHLIELDLKHLVIREADGENELFYGVPGVSIRDILSGQIKTPSGASTQLCSTLNALRQPNSSLSGLPRSRSRQVHIWCGIRAECMQRHIASRRLKVIRSY